MTCNLNKQQISTFYFTVMGLFFASSLYLFSFKIWVLSNFNSSIYFRIVISSAAWINLWICGSTRTRLSYLSVPPYCFGNLWWQWISSRHWNSISVIPHLPNWAEYNDILLSLYSVLFLPENFIISTRSEVFMLNKSYWINWLIWTSHISHHRCISV